MSERHMAEVLEKNIAVRGCEFSRTALVIRTADEATFIEVGRWLQTVEVCRAWWWGDFVVAYCKFRIEQDEADGECEPDPKVREERMVRYAAQYAQIAGVEVGTMKAWKQVAAFFEPLSRLTGLSWAHHFEAYAGSEGDLAVAQNWLERANREGWSKAQLRAAIRQQKRTAAVGATAEPAREVLFPEWDKAERWASAAITRVGDMDEEELEAIVEGASAVIRLVEAATKTLQRKRQEAA